MANLQLSKEHCLKRQFIFAFPGMGKTPLALNNGGFVDADFGFLREAFLVDKEREASLFKPYARIVKLYAKQGNKVLINQPDIVRFVPANNAVMFLPIELKYSAQKMKVSEDQIARWIGEWSNMASAAHVPVVWLSEGLDSYLK